MQKHRNTGRRVQFVLAFVLALFAQMGAQAAGYQGTAPEAGNNYYLYNVYQAKFLSYGNSYGTQVSLDNSKPLLCTLEASGDKAFVLNTHYSLETQAWKADVTNYVIYTSEGTFVNARWGDSDTNYNNRDATVFTIAEADEGYYLDCANGALMFDAGTACVVGNRSEGFNADKSLWRFVTEAEYNEMQQKNRFTVAAMNVDGMPVSIKVAGIYTVNLNDDGKEAAGATAIGKKLNTLGYDIVAASEDFNYNDEIMAEISNTYSQGTHRGKIDGSLGTLAKYIAKQTLFDTDGLNLFWKKDAIGATGESWTAWNEHYGYDDHEADGLIEKGYRYYLITLGDGTQVDLYILHMEAGSDTGDNAARATQITQLADAIIASDNGRPIIVMGDTNCRYTRDALKSRFIDVINADPRFTVRDPWVDYGRQGIYPSGTNDITAGTHGYRKGEVVDKVLYINNTQSNIRLVAEAYRQDLSFVNDAGEALADHWPCVVDFSYHAYDPAIDDVVSTTAIKSVYLRNVELGTYLKAGGWWGTHAVSGIYGSELDFTPLPNGKYVLQTPMGFLSQGDSYMDASTQDGWTLQEQGGHYMLTYTSDGTTKALTGNDPAAFPYGPNVRYVTCADLNTEDRYQMWDIVTREELMVEMLSASQAVPYNCTFLLPGANFDRNDSSSKSTDNGGAWSCTISANASKMKYNFSDGKGDFWLGNYVGEVFVESYSGITTYATQWEVSQTLTGLPNGRYKVTCQGFYRDGDMNQNNPGTIHSYLYARTNGGATEVSTALKSMYSAQCTTNFDNAISTTDGNGYYIPNDMAGASIFFANGYYENEVLIDVVDGTLTVAVGKPDVTKDTSGWTCFDNFQIQYLGLVPADAATGYYWYNIDAGAFLNANTHNIVAGDWDTRAVLDTEGTAWTTVTSTHGYRLQQVGRSGVYLGATSAMAAWADRTDAGESEFTLTQGADNLYTIANVASAGTAMGWSGEYGNQAITPLLSVNDKEPRGTRWMRMDDNLYKQVQANVAAVHETRMALWPVVRAVRSSALAPDIASEEAVWNNPVANALQLTTAVESMKTKLLALLPTASLTQPVDLSFFVQNTDFSGDLATTWTNDGFTSHGNYYPASASGGASLGTLFTEKYVDWGKALPNVTLSQTVSGLPEGVYAVGADVILRKWDENPASGIQLYAQPDGGDKLATLCQYDSDTNFYAQSGFFRVGEGQSLTVGFRIQDTENVNWVAFDNYRLLYLGQYLPGDINHDGGLSIADAIGIADIILGKDSGDEPLYDHALADVNGDGVVTLADVTALVNKVLKK